MPNSMLSNVRYLMEEFLLCPEMGLIFPGLGGAGHYSVLHVASDYPSSSSVLTQSSKTEIAFTNQIIDSWDISMLLWLLQRKHGPNQPCMMCQKMPACWGCHIRLAQWPSQPVIARHLLLYISAPWQNAQITWSLNIGWPCIIYMSVHQANIGLQENVIGVGTTSLQIKVHNNIVPCFKCQQTTLNID